MSSPPESSTALVTYHRANHFELRDDDHALDRRGGAVVFDHANVAGDPQLSHGDRSFFGDAIERLDTPLGELVTVTLESRPSGERWRRSLLFPRTWVAGDATVAVEVLVIDSVRHGRAHGPPPGQEVVVERTWLVRGHARHVPE